MAPPSTEKGTVRFKLQGSPDSKVGETDRLYPLMRQLQNHLTVNTDTWSSWRVWPFLQSISLLDGISMTSYWEESQRGVAPLREGGTQAPDQTSKAAVSRQESEIPKHI